MLGVLLLLAAQDIDGLLRSLDHEDVQVREAAAAGLLDRWQSWTPEDLGKLKKASESQATERAARASDLVRRIGLRRSLGADLVRLLPRADSILLGGTPEERKGLLVQAHRLWRLADIDGPSARALAEAVGADGIPLIGEATIGTDCIIRPFIPAFRAGLQDPKRRADAIDTLASLDARELRGEIAPFLAHPDEKVRAAAAGALVDWGMPVDVKDLAAIALQGRRHAREGALFVLPKVKHPASIAALATLLKDPEEWFRNRAIDGLVEAGAKDQAAAVAALIDDPSPSVRIRALKAIGTWGAREHADAVLARMGDRIGGVAREAAVAIRAFGPSGFTKKLIPFLAHPEHDARWAAWDLLLEGNEDLDATLLGMLRHPKPEVRITAATRIAQRWRTRDGPALAALLKDPSSSVRQAVLEEIGDPAFADQLPAVAACLEDPEPSNRGHAAVALARFGDRSRSGTVVRLLESEDEWAVELAARALGWMADRAHAKAVAARLRTHPHIDGGALAAALASMGAREEAGTVADALANPDFDDVPAGLKALWTLRSDRLEGCLERLLASDDESDLRAALWMLGTMGTPAALRKLEPHLNGPLRSTAAAAILSTGRPEVFEKAAALVADPDFEVRAGTAWSIARWTTAGPPPPDPARLERMLERMDEDRDDDLRAAAIAIRVGLRRREPAALLPHLGDYPWARIDHLLAFATARVAFLKLRAPVEIKSEIRSLAELRRALPVPVEIDPHFVFLGCLREGTRMSGLELLEVLLPRDDLRRMLDPRPGLAVRDGVLHLLPLERANEEWRRALGGK